MAVDRTHESAPARGLGSDNHAGINPEVLAALQAANRGHVHWDERRAQVRWMTAFDTTEEDVDAFAELIARALAQAR
ncbi:MAG: hypothetical protein AB1505_14925 [Candidatus Latescibacterota bacterium]